ncbi:b39.4 [miniopterid betaherpesvirus 1]|uniref:B39.4 n=1 Tax=miniopterid betaherpesvirus 1 TaxID=3070189 RepID=I3VQ19_9BETA|nr:b39.4 [miniopterid betaherpesvirus 1]AFK83863.1 b39.4 [miniopterid betaherpesvirus 1]
MSVRRIDSSILQFLFIYVSAVRFGSGEPNLIVPGFLRINFTTWSDFSVFEGTNQTIPPEIDWGASMILDNGVTFAVYNASERDTDELVYGLNTSVLFQAFERFVDNDRAMHRNYTILRMPGSSRHLKSHTLTVKIERICFYSFERKQRSTIYGVFQGERHDYYEIFLTDSVQTTSRPIRRDRAFDDLSEQYGRPSRLRRVFERQHNETQDFCEVHFYKKLRAPTICVSHSRLNSTHLTLTCHVNGYKPDNVSVRWYVTGFSNGSGPMKPVVSTISKGSRETTVVTQVPWKNIISYFCGIHHDLLKDGVYVSDSLSSDEYLSLSGSHDRVLLSVMCYGGSVSLLLLFVGTLARRNFINAVSSICMVRWSYSLKECLALTSQSFSHMVKLGTAVTFIRTRWKFFGVGDDVARLV